VKARPNFCIVATRFRPLFCLCKLDSLLSICAKHNPFVLQRLQKGIRALHAICVSVVYILLHDFKMLFKTVVPNCSIIHDPWTDSITHNAKLPHVICT
jgi:hypothetical protein